MYYVYHLIDPRTDAVFYVGKGKDRRIAEHEKEARAGKPGAKCDRIRDIWSGGHQVARKVVQDFDDERAAYEFEMREIDRLGLDTLCNAVRGNVPDLSFRNPEPLKPLSRDDAAAALCRIFGRSLIAGADGLLATKWRAALFRALGRKMLEIERRHGRDFVDAHMKTAGVQVEGDLFPA